jgi:hypothetical protein
MNYNYRLVKQESDHVYHIPNGSDFFVIENWGKNDAIFFRLDNFLKESPPYYPSRRVAWNRCLEWLKENHPEFFI